MLALFSERDPAPRTLPLSSSQEPVRKKQRGRGTWCSVSSELTMAQPPCALLSLHREASPVLFSQLDQRPSVAMSDLVSFGGSEDEALDNSISLVASDAELPPLDKSVAAGRWPVSWSLSATYGST
ncbi:hypothetical protein Q8A67_010899 [Cirrhinus molitorella]|uniref:Uncharacterized protein n=1 Tax=Cirrhinus molitorella TaxID=172907 RepID=A0AA88PMA9_9TELE|nr:hypothetical protein Q8A67_010899 [Cirrhinus molitorella]